MIIAIWYWLLGMIGCMALTFVGPFSFKVAVPLTFALFIFSEISTSPARGLNMLSRMCLVLFYLPLSALIDCLFMQHPTFAEGYPLVDSALGNHVIVDIAASVGLIGLLGLACGIRVAGAFSGRGAMDLGRVRRPLTSAQFALLILPLVAFMYFVVPKDTILTMTYGDIIDYSSSRVSTKGLDGYAYLVYVVLVAGYCDLQFSRRIGMRSQFKAVVLWTSVLFVTIVCNLMRGGRSSAGLVAAITALYLTDILWVDSRRRRARWMRVAVIGVAIVSVYFSWDTVRNIKQDREILREQLETRFANFNKSGTWMGGFYALIGMADEYASGNFQLLYGKTYLDYVLSAPPSMVARRLNYVRPLEASQGPGWWYMGYTAGGMHPTVVPFKNFGAIGVLIHMFAVGLFLGAIERLAIRGTFGARVTYGAIFISSLHWFWYGDMYVLRALMAAVIVYVLYKFLTGNVFVPFGPPVWPQAGMEIASSPPLRDERQPRSS